MAQQFPIPQILGIAQIHRGETKIEAYQPLCLFFQRTWTTRTLPLLKPSKTAAFKPPNPILDRAMAMTEKVRHLPTTEARTNQKNPVQAMIITRFLGPHDLVLQRQSHDFGIFNLQFLHGPLLSEGNLTTK
jgi:hypothetical protein